MGRLIEEVAENRGHTISCIIDVETLGAFSSKEFRESDVAIEFTAPSGAVGGILASFAAGVPVVSGTTGWNDSMDEVKEMCLKSGGALLYSSNFSIGMNIFMALNRRLASVMNDFPQYEPSLEETHHIHKLDHPSGTALTLAAQIIDKHNATKGWVEIEDGKEPKEGILPIKARREGEINGIHTVSWTSPYDCVSMTHEAFNRVAFAEGAVRAAEWLKGRKGFFTIGDMLGDVTGIKGLFE